MANETILIIEDERPLAEALTYSLKAEGFEVIHAADGQDGLLRAQRTLPDLVLLDLMLPLVDGLEICRRLRADPRTRDIPIVMLTARSEEIDEILGFRMGADDYVTKPFKTKVLIQRLKALLRRQGPREPLGKDVVTRQGLTIDRLHHRAVLDGQALPLTPTEFKLLWTLIRQPGRTYSRNELMDASRGEDANALERTIDVHVRSLRLKLKDKAHLVETVRGIGYRFRDECGEAGEGEAAPPPGGEG